MTRFSDKIRQLREENGLLQRQMSAALEMDTGLYSKIERGDRKAKREHISKMAELLHTDKDELMNLWLADQVYLMVKDEKHAETVLGIVAESMMDYGSKNKKQ